MGPCQDDPFSFAQDSWNAEAQCDWTKWWDSTQRTIVTVSVYTKGQRIKGELAIAKPKKKFDKKETIKKRDIDREIAGALKKRY